MVDEGFEEDGFVLPDLLAGSADVGLRNPLHINAPGRKETQNPSQWQSEVSLFPLFSDSQSAVSNVHRPERSQYSLQPITERCQYNLQPITEEQLSLLQPSGLQHGFARKDSSKGFLPEPWAYEQSQCRQKASFAEPQLSDCPQVPTQSAGRAAQQFLNSSEWLSCNSAVDLHSQQDAVVPQPQLTKDGSMWWTTSTEQMETNSTEDGISNTAGTCTDLSRLPCHDGADWQLCNSVLRQHTTSSPTNHDHSSSHSEVAADPFYKISSAKAMTVSDPSSSFQQQPKVMQQGPAHLQTSAAEPDHSSPYPMEVVLNSFPGSQRMLPTRDKQLLRSRPSWTAGYEQLKSPELAAREKRRRSYEGPFSNEDRLNAYLRNRQSLPQREFNSEHLEDIAAQGISTDFEQSQRDRSSRSTKATVQQHPKSNALITRPEWKAKHDSFNEKASLHLLRQAFGVSEGVDACKSQEVTKKVLEVQQKLLQVARAQTSQQLHHLQEQLAKVNAREARIRSLHPEVNENLEYNCFAPPQ